MATLLESLTACEAASAEAGAVDGVSVNFPTAYAIAQAGIPIARRAWAGEYDAAPARWITAERGAWFDNRPGVRALLQVGDSPSLTEADYRAQDWRVPSGTRLTGIAARPDFPRSGDGGSEPLFDVFNPPSKL
jgi:hypothetical protein